MRVYMLSNLFSLLLIDKDIAKEEIRKLSARQINLLITKTRTEIAMNKYSANAEYIQLLKLLESC